MSIIFANPSSPIWKELKVSRAFLDERSGLEWDLFFAGISAFLPMPGETESIAILRDPTFAAIFNPKIFSEVEREVTSGHKAALGRERSEAEPWRYRGGTDVVSFMAYGGDPDWLSLKSVPLYTAAGEQLTVLHVVEGLSKWQQDVVDPLLAPGEELYGVSRPSALLTAGLGYSANAATAGVLGNAAYALLKAILG